MSLLRVLSHVPRLLLTRYCFCTLRGGRGGRGKGWQVGVRGRAGKDKIWLGREGKRGEEMKGGRRDVWLFFLSPSGR